MALICKIIIAISEQIGKYLIAFELPLALMDVEIMFFVFTGASDDIVSDKQVIFEVNKKCHCHSVFVLPVLVLPWRRCLFKANNSTKGLKLFCWF